MPILHEVDLYITADAKRIEITMALDQMRPLQQEMISSIA
jgi:hypothetical protein